MNFWLTMALVVLVACALPYLVAWVDALRFRRSGHACRKDVNCRALAAEPKHAAALVSDGSTPDR